nr:unnamed protein product [Digitaria exilis]
MSMLQRTMPMRVLSVGKKRSRGTQLLVEEYKEKLGYYCDFEDTLIKSNPKLTSILCFMCCEVDHDIGRVVVLDENGKDVISEQIADLIGAAGSTGSSRLTFCIGGPYGLGVQVRARADATIRLSSLVLNHQVALIVLVEQLYRSEILLSDEILTPQRSFCGSTPGMDYNKRTEISPLGICVSSSSSTAV